MSLCARILETAAGIAEWPMAGLLSQADSGLLTFVESFAVGILFLDFKDIRKMLPLLFAHRTMLLLGSEADLRWFASRQQDCKACHQRQP